MKFFNILSSHIFYNDAQFEIDYNKIGVRLYENGNLGIIFKFS